MDAAEQEKWGSTFSLIVDQNREALTPTITHIILRKVDGSNLYKDSLLTDRMTELSIHTLHFYPSLSR